VSRVALLRFATRALQGPVPSISYETKLVFTPGVGKLRPNSKCVYGEGVSGWQSAIVLGVFGLKEISFWLGFPFSLLYEYHTTDSLIFVKST
jgi:hypothetical protein